MGSKQLNILNVDKLDEPKENIRNSRPKERPSEMLTSIRHRKETSANASAFGWEFQIISAIILSIQNISNVKNVKVEGNTEDVEIYLNNDDPIYIQVKATSIDSDIFNDQTQFANAAFNTLLNTSILTKGKYSKLIYVSNFNNPMRLNEADKNEYWLPTMNEIFYRSYGSLPIKGKKYLENRLEAGSNSLKKNNYYYITKYFDWSKFYISTVVMHANDANNRYSVLDKTIYNFLGNTKLSDNEKSSLSTKLRDSWIARYFDNATSKNETIEKDYLAWTTIIKSLEDTKDDILDDADIDIQDEVEQYENGFISDQMNNMELVNGVIAGFQQYIIYNKKKSRDSHVARSFIENRWTDFKNSFPIDAEDDVKEWGIKCVLWRILRKRKVIDSIKRAVNL